MKIKGDPVAVYISAQKKIMEQFGCKEEFFIKPMFGIKWLVRNDDGFYFLTYWNENDNKMDAVVVTKGSGPMVFKTAKYTMVIAIDCVKTAFIFQNELMSV